MSPKKVVLIWVIGYDFERYLKPSIHITLGKEVEVLFWGFILVLISYFLGGFVYYYVREKEVKLSKRKDK